MIPTINKNVLQNVNVQRLMGGLPSTQVGEGLGDYVEQIEAMKGLLLQGDDLSSFFDGSFDSIIGDILKKFLGDTGISVPITPDILTRSLDILNQRKSEAAQALQTVQSPETIREYMKAKSARAKGWLARLIGGTDYVDKIMNSIQSTVDTNQFSIPNMQNPISSAKDMVTNYVSMNNLSEEGISPAIARDFIGGSELPRNMDILTTQLTDRFI